MFVLSCTFSWYYSGSIIHPCIVATVHLHAVLMLRCFLLQCFCHVEIVQLNVLGPSRFYKLLGMALVFHCRMVSTLQLIKLLVPFRLVRLYCAMSVHWTLSCSVGLLMAAIVHPLPLRLGEFIEFLLFLHHDGEVVASRSASCGCDDVISFIPCGRSRFRGAFR